MKPAINVRTGDGGFHLMEKYPDQEQDVKLVYIYFFF